MDLILASRSERRKDMLTLMGYDFTAIESSAEENIPHTEPSSFVEQLAYLKAEDVFFNNPSACVLGSDTVVYLDGQIIGKPKDPADAKRILTMLSGRTHTVYTGVAILYNSTRIVFHDTTDVTFGEITDTDIDNYIASGEPMDKAGAYGVQGIGCAFVEKVAGNYFTAIGLPNRLVFQALKTANILPKWYKK